MSVTGSLDALRGLSEQDIATFLNSVDSKYLMTKNDRGELARWGYGANSAGITLTPEQRIKIQHAFLPPRNRRMRTARVAPIEGGLTKKKSKKRSKTSKRRNKGKKKSAKKGKKSARKTKKQHYQLLGGEDPYTLYYTRNVFHVNLNELIDECMNAVYKVITELDRESESYDKVSAFYESVYDYLLRLKMEHNGDEKMRILSNLVDNANKSSEEDPIKAEIIKVIKGEGPYKAHEGEESILVFFRRIQRKARINNLFDVESRRGGGKKNSAKNGKKTARKTRKRGNYSSRKA